MSKLNIDVAAIITASGTLLRSAKGSDATKESSHYNMPFPKIDPKQLGKPKWQNVKSTPLSYTWQSNNDDIMEYFGLQEKSGYDVKFTGRLQYRILTYENLVEPIIRNLWVYGAVNYNTFASYVMSSKMNYEIDLSTAPNDTKPRGRVYFDFSLDTGLDRDKGRMLFNIEGATCKPSGGWG